MKDFSSLTNNILDKSSLQAFVTDKWFYSDGIILYPVFPPVFHTVLESFLTTGHLNTRFFVNPFPHKPWFLRVCSTNLLKTLWKKEKLLATSNFSFSHNVFNTYGEISAIFIEFRIVVCELFQFGSVKNCGLGKD